MEKENDIIPSLIVEGAITGELAILLERYNKSNSVIIALAVAAIISSFKARKNAFETTIPVLTQEGYALNEVHSDGTRKFIKNLPVSSIQVPDIFILE
jgi:hypothetical protein